MASAPPALRPQGPDPHRAPQLETLHPHDEPPEHPESQGTAGNESRSPRGPQHRGCSSKSAWVSSPMKEWHGLTPNRVPEGQDSAGTFSGSPGAGGHQMLAVGALPSTELAGYHQPLSDSPSYPSAPLTPPGFSCGPTMACAPPKQPPPHQSWCVPSAGTRAPPNPPLPGQTPLASTSIPQRGSCPKGWPHTPEHQQQLHPGLRAQRTR